MGAFLLALGIGCHALDGLAGRPLGTRLSSRALVGLAVTGLMGAAAIGIVGAIVLSEWLIPFVVLGAFLALAYNLELLVADSTPTSGSRWLGEDFLRSPAGSWRP